MVVKINSKPIQVTEEPDKPWYEEVNWGFMAISSIGYLLAFWILDYGAAIFLGIHPFPFIKFVGGVLKWVGLV